MNHFVATKFMSSIPLSIILILRYWSKQFTHVSDFEIVKKHWCGTCNVCAYFCKNLQRKRNRRRERKRANGGRKIYRYMDRWIWMYVSMSSLLAYRFFLHESHDFVGCLLGWLPKHNFSTFLWFHEIKNVVKKIPCAKFEGSTITACAARNYFRCMHLFLIFAYFYVCAFHFRDFYVLPNRCMDFKTQKIIEIEIDSWFEYRVFTCPAPRLKESRKMGFGGHPNVYANIAMDWISAAKNNYLNCNTLRFQFLCSFFMLGNNNLLLITNAIFLP